MGKYCDLQWAFFSQMYLMIYSCLITHLGILRYMGNSQSKYKLTERELCDKLRDLVKWEVFALYLPGIRQTHIEVIKHNNPLDVDQQKQALFAKWLRVCPKACWNDVILALEKVDENTIVAEITANRQSSPDEIFIQKSIVERLSELHDEFCSLSIECEESLKELVKSGKVSLKKLIIEQREREHLTWRI